jgi:hypothetical protein
VVGKLNGAIVGRSTTKKRTLISRIAPPNPLMQPTNAGDAGRRPHPSLPATTTNRRLSLGRLQLMRISLGSATDPMESRLSRRHCLWCTLLLFGGISPHAASAQNALAPRCASVRPAHSARTDWYNAEGDYIRDTTPQAPKALSEHFRKAYTLLVVRTEGTQEKLVDEYELQWSWPTDSQLQVIQQIGAVEAGALTIPLVGTLVHKRSANGTVVKHKAPRWDISGPIQLEYWPKIGKLGFSIGLNLDAGTLFHITKLDADGSFAGRWTDGGMSVIQFDTPLGPLAEAVRGYFCGVVLSR